MEVAIGYIPRPGKQLSHFVLDCQTDERVSRFLFLKENTSLLELMIRELQRGSGKGCSVLQACLCDFVFAFHPQGQD